MSLHLWRKIIIHIEVTAINQIITKPSGYKVLEVIKLKNTPLIRSMLYYKFKYIQVVTNSESSIKELRRTLARWNRFKYAAKRDMPEVEFRPKMRISSEPKISMRKKLIKPKVANLLWRVANGKA